MTILWIPITIAAAFLQNLRSALQKAIKGRLSNTGAAYVRFFYAWPFAVIYTWSLTGLGGYVLPSSNPTFLIYCALGGLAQILFTVVLLSRGSTPKKALIRRDCSTSQCRVISIRR